MPVIGEKRVDIQMFLDTVDAGITQCNSDITALANITTLAEAKPILEHLLNRQKKIMQASKILVQQYRQKEGG